MSGVWRLLPCLGLRYVVWRHGGGATRLWAEKRSVLRCPMQRTALPLAARCNYGCSALHLKSGCSADSWGMGPASFFHCFPLLLPSLSASPPIAFRFFPHRFPLLLPLLSAPSPIAFRSFSHRFPLLLPSFSTSPLIAFRFSSHSFPFLLPSRSARLCPALPPSSYCMAKPCRPWCHAGLCCIVRPRQRTCALWDGLMSCVGRGAQYWNV